MRYLLYIYYAGYYGRGQALYTTAQFKFNIMIQTLFIYKQIFVYLYIQKMSLKKKARILDKLFKYF